MSFFKRLIAKIKFLLLGNTKGKKKSVKLLGIDDEHKPQLAINDDGSIHYFGVNEGEASVIEEESVNYRKKKDDGEVAQVVVATAATTYSYGDYDDSVSSRGSSSSSNSSSSSSYSSGYSSYSSSDSSSSCSSDSGGGGGD